MIGGATALKFNTASHVGITDVCEPGIAEGRAQGLFCCQHTLSEADWTENQPPSPFLTSLLTPHSLSLSLSSYIVFFRIFDRLR